MPTAEGWPSWLAGRNDLTAAQAEGLLGENALPGEWPLGFGERALNGGAFGPPLPSAAALLTGRHLERRSNSLPNSKQEHTPRARSSEIPTNLMMGCVRRFWSCSPLGGEGSGVRGK